MPTVIDFSNLGQFDSNGVAFHYSQAGFTLALPPGDPTDEPIWAANYFGTRDKGTGNYIQNNHAGETLELTKDGGGTFGLASLKLDGFFNYSDSEEGLTLTIVGTFADGHSQTFYAHLDGNDGFQTFFLSPSFAANLVKVAFIAPGFNAIQMDDITFAAGVLVNGTPANDVIDGVQAPGANIDGKTGVDTLTFAAATGGVTADLGAGTASGPGFNVTMVNIENLTGSDYGDSLTGNAATNVLSGGAGDDALYGGGGRDSLYGGDGADLLDGGIAADNMAGGLGDDIYMVDNAADVVTELGGEGYDTVNASVTWKATASSSIEKIVLTGTASIGATGNGMTQEIVGNSGANQINDGGGAAVMKGGAGNDTYVVTNAGSTVVEDAGGGGDAILTTLDTFVMPDNIERLSYTGAGNFHATGSAGGETIIGGAGDDVLNGNGGADKLTGGAGADTFVFNASNQTTVVVNDFTAGVDKLQLIFAPGGADFVIGNASTNGVGGHATIVYDPNSGKLYWESDGLAAHKVLLANLTAHLDLHGTDFIFGP